MDNNKKRYEILDSLPSYGPMYISISESGIPFYSEGFVVRFIKDDDTEWVANFEAGWGLDRVFDYPEKNLIVVIASGNGYVMNPNLEKPIKFINSMVKEAFQAESGDLIFIDDTGIEIFNPENLDVWTSERISWDGFKELRFENEIITGKSFDPTNSIKEWSEFSFNVKNKEIIGGSFRDSLKRNSHLEMKNRNEVKTKKNSDKQYDFENNITHETIDDNEIEQKDPTNWKAWYWGLMIFLGVQIALYFYITNLYTV